MKLMFIAKETVRGVLMWAVMMSFVVAIFATVAIPANRPSDGVFDWLLYSMPSRFIAASVMTGVFGWIFCLGAKPFWQRTAMPATAAVVESAKSFKQ